MALIIPEWVHVFGDPADTKKGTEDFCLESFFNKLRKERPFFAKITTHVQNERKRTYAQVQADKLKGMVPGWPDATTAGSPTLLQECKVVGGVWQPNQLEVMRNAYDAGSFVTLAWGSRGLWEGFLYWEANIWHNRPVK